MAVTRRARVTDESPAEETNTTEETTRSGGVTRAPRKLSAWQAVGKPKEDREERKSAPYINFGKQSGTKILRVVHDGPQAEYKRHFVKSANKMFYCPKGEDEDNFCALCDKGHTSRWVFRFNVVEMNDDPTEVRTWDLGWKDAESLMNLAAEEQQVPVDEVKLNSPELYWKVIYTRGSGNTLIPLDIHTIEKKHNMMALTDNEIEELEETSYGLETVFKNGDKYLREAASALTDSDTKSD